MVKDFVCVLRETNTASNEHSFTFPSTRKKPKRKEVIGEKRNLFTFCTNNL